VGVSGGKDTKKRITLVSLVVKSYGGEILLCLCRVLSLKDSSEKKTRTLGRKGIELTRRERIDYQQFGEVGAASVGSRVSDHVTGSREGVRIRVNIK